MRISIQGLSKSFEGVQVLHDLNFSDELSTLAVIGPSGCGKSTFLRMLGGLLEPSSGGICVDGVQVPFGNEAQLARYRASLGFVFQSSGLFAHMSARENIEVPLRVVHGVSPDEAHARASELLERFGLAQQEGKRPVQLSGGQRQRVALARAIAPQPRMLLLDEPTSALDPEYTTEVLDIVNDLKNDGIRFIIVTHEMGFARHACDKVMFIAEGDILEYGSGEDLFEHPQTLQLKRFLGKLLEWSV